MQPVEVLLFPSRSQARSTPAPRALKHAPVHRTARFDTMVFSRTEHTPLLTGGA